MESDPQRSFPVVLTQHEARPKDQQPIYYFRYLSIRDRRDFDELARDRRDFADRLAEQIGRLSQKQEGGDVPPDLAKVRDEGLAIIQRAEDLVRRVFCGWLQPESPSGEPIAGDFTPDRMDEVFDQSDIEDLLSFVPAESRLRAIDRKNSIARSLANSAAAAKADAKPPAA